MIATANSTLLVGVLTGLGAAFFQSLAYLATRHFVQLRGGGSRTLLVISHVQMALVAAALLPLAWPSPMPAWSTILNPLFGVTIFYLLGQMGLMMALRHAEASQISPMLAFKLVILAGLTVMLTSVRILPMQWLAIAMCLGGTILLNYSGHHGQKRTPLLLIGFTCLSYAISDWNIVRLVNVLHESERWRALIWSSLASYCLCGLMAAAFLPMLGSRKASDWVDAVPFSAAWLCAMVFLFACFGIVGVVYGNILQSTRGLVSVGLGAVLAHWGLAHLEQKATRAVFVRRLLAATMMLGAVAIYAFYSARPAATPGTGAPAATATAPID